MNRELATQIRNQFTGNSTLNTLVTGVYLLQAPQGQGYPYITFFPVSDVPITVHCNTRLEDTDWQFSIFTDSLSALASIHSEILSSFDGQTLNLNTLTQAGMIRTQSLGLTFDHQDEVGNVYHRPVQYRIVVK